MVETSSSVSFDIADMFPTTNDYDDVVVVKALINNYDVHRVLVNTGSSVNIIFHDAAVKIGLFSQNYKPSSGSLVGFSGERMEPVGEIVLPVTLGEGENFVTHQATFIILRANSPYNCIFGIPILNQFRAIVSTFHMTVIISTPFGPARIQADMTQSRRCSLNSLRSDQSVLQVKLEER